MRKHADIMRPKFEAVISILERELDGLGIGTWTNPKGGYFISFDSLDGCAKAIVARCKKAGLVMTGAGATYPYGKDPHDSNIRIAPSYPPLSDLVLAMELFALCVKMVSIDKLLTEMKMCIRDREVTTGGQRIHDYQMIVDKMEKRGMDPADIESYLMIFKYGMPPHGGLGIGLERLTMRLLDEQNVRETALFPRDVTRLEP